MWYNTTDPIFYDVVKYNEEIVVEICKFANWLLRRKLSSGISSSDLRSVMDMAIVIALNNENFAMDKIKDNFKFYFKEIATKASVRNADISFYLQQQSYRDVDLEIDLSNAMSILKRKEREAVTLHLIQEKNMEDVAEIMKITKTTVYRLIVSAKNKMRNHLQEGKY